MVVGTRFVLPNKLRPWRDPNTNQRVISPRHFLFKLEFGDLSFAVARALQAGLGAHSNQCNRERREAGEGDQLTVFIHHTAEEQQRQRRADNSNGNQGN